jgi:dihydroorotate dehydrogenase (NAD+) catalytic subunit
LAQCDDAAKARDAYVVASLIVSDLDRAVSSARHIESAGLRWLELNIGAPHAEEAAPGAIRTESEAHAVMSLVRPIRQALSIKLTVKVSGQHDPLPSVEAAWAAGADAVCLAGRSLGFLPDPTTRRPFLGTFGAIGGAWALPLTLRWIAKARIRFGPGLSIVGTNGARDGLDVVRFLLAGASAVQMTTAVMTDGPEALAAAVRRVDAYLSEQGMTARSIIGEAADHVMTYEEVAEG